MKKRLLTVIALAVALTTGTALAAELIADGGDPLTAIDVGAVTIANDGLGNLVVTFTIDTGEWEFVETHLHIAEDPADIPQTGNGNPKVGKFDYNQDDAVVTPTQHTYTIPLSAIVLSTIGNKPPNCSKMDISSCVSTP